MAKTGRVPSNRSPGAAPPRIARTCRCRPGRCRCGSRGTWRKRWRYVGAFGERVMLCAASVRIGPLGQTFWAILDRESGEVIEHTKQLLPGAARRGLDRARRRPRGLGAGLGRRRPADEDRRRAMRPRKLSFAECGVWAESICPNGAGGYVWTRKRPSWIDLDLDLGERGQDPRVAARDRGRVGGLPPAPHRLELVGGGRDERRRP